MERLLCVADIRMILSGAWIQESVVMEVILKFSHLI